MEAWIYHDFKGDHFVPPALLSLPQGLFEHALQDGVVEKKVFMVAQKTSVKSTEVLFYFYHHCSKKAVAKEEGCGVEERSVRL